MRLRRIDDWVSNHSDRLHQPIATVIHYTGAPWTSRPSQGEYWSYHTEIAGDTRRRMVHYGDEAWHAGRGEILVNGESRQSPNRFTIGVAFRNCGLLEEVAGEFFFEAGGRLVPYKGPDPVRAQLQFDSGIEITGWWQPYTEADFVSLIEELDEIKRAGFPVPAKTLVGHEDIAMPLGRRKFDPGPLFPWAKLKVLGIDRLNPRTRGVLL